MKLKSDKAAGVLSGKLPVPKQRLLRGFVLVLNYYLLGGREANEAYRLGAKEGRKSLGLDLDFAYDMPIETEEWTEWYTPPPFVKPDDLIVDVGARDGDTLFFYARLGFKNFRAIEPKPECQARLRHNVAELARFYGVKVEVRQKCFTPEDLEGARFVKFDCEGCEWEMNLVDLKIPAVAELHPSPKKDNRGIYISSVKAAGYRKYGDWKGDFKAELEYDLDYIAP